MKMDLREILAGGGSVTEIRASEVLVIKPSASSEERNLGGGGGGGGREDGETKCTVDGRRESMCRELRTDISWLREKEKERPCGQATVIKEGRKGSLDDNVFTERGGRVSQLLSKFGEHPKPPSRSKSSDNFLRPGRRKYSGDHDDQQSEERNMMMKCVPKRSFSFSDRVICAKENGLDEDEYYEKTMLERIHSDKRLAPWMDVAGLGKETTPKIKMGCAWLLDKDKFGKQSDGHVKNEGPEAEKCMQHRNEVKKVEPVDKRAAEMADDAQGDEGFTVVSVKNTEGISFARRVPIRQDGKARAAEREVKRLSLERELSVEKDSEVGGQIEAQVSNKKFNFQRVEAFESTILAETLQNYVTDASAELTGSCHTAESHYRHESAFTECSSLICTVAERGAEWSGTGPPGPYQTHSVLSQHTEDLISKIEKLGDTTIYSNEKAERAYRAAYEITKESKQELQVYNENLGHDVTPRSPKKIAPMGIPPGPLEIQIPRTVFYVAEDMSDMQKVASQSEEGQDWEGGRRAERRDSRRIGKPLSRIESLREKIRQRELERLRQIEAQDGDGSDGAEDDAQAAGDRYDDRGSEIEWVTAAQMQKRLVETERGQEDTALQTSATAFDMTQEVSVLKTCPQLPVSVTYSQSVRIEEVANNSDTAASEVISDSFQTSEDEDDPLEHVEEQLRCHRSLHESRGEEEREQEEEKELSEEEEEEYILPLDPAQSLSPSPPHPNSLAAMSRIYNLETVGSRSALCLRDRTVDIPSVHLRKVNPLISNTQQGDSKGLSGEDICGVQAIQRQIEQFQLKEQEALKSQHALKDREAKGQQSPRGVLKHQVKDDVKIKDQETPETSPRVSPQHVCSPTSQLKQSNQTITIIPSYLRSQSPDNSLKLFDCAPTPASSPCSPSPTQSPSVSPSPSPSPTHFSIRSASGGKVKRGATITITPKKSGGGGGGGGGKVAGSTTGSTPAGSTTSKMPQQQAHTTSTVAEPAKKRYPTVDEIEVIGGYQNLEKSCLVKNKGTPKRGKVCFDENQLEQVCEYPSEASMLACTPYSHDLGRMDRLQGEEAQEEAALVEGGAPLSKSTRNVGITTGRGLRVGQCHPLLKKHSV